VITQSALWKRPARLGPRCPISSTTVRNQVYSRRKMAFLARSGSAIQISNKQISAAGSIIPKLLIGQ
jgi:hypothetical protein